MVSIPLVRLEMWGVGWTMLEVMVWCFPEIVTSAYVTLNEILLDKFA